ncbi:MAG: hypothetical protein LBP61_09630 [Desulfovibrio sp.]|jgi:hypothetical protein|nr:hypothetical protein [Desulfovibrio sp.]
MSMSQLLGVWNSMPRTNAAELSTQNMAGASNSYANMDKAVNQTQTTTVKQPETSFLGDILPVVGGIAGGIVGSVVPGLGTAAGISIGSGLGGALGGAVGGQNAGSLGGMGIGLGYGLNQMGIGLPVLQSKSKK